MIFLKEKIYSRHSKIFVMVFLIIFLLINININSSTAQENNKLQNKKYNNIDIYNFFSYKDLNKDIVIVGSIAGSNNLTLSYPVEATVALDVYNKDTNNYETIKEQPFKKVIYDINEPIPFKFIINASKYQLKSNYSPYIYNIRKADIQSTKINTFSLKYNEAILGPNKELFGSVRNTGPSTIRNLTLYAIVHTKNGTQIDSVKTTISTIKPNETKNFIFTPNIAIKDLVFTYSCVGGELQDVNAYQTIKLNSNKTLGYRFSGLMEINSIIYNNKTNSLRLEVNNIYPIAAALSIQLTPTQTTPLNILLDNQLFNSQTIKDSEKTKLYMYIPQGKHEIYIQGINS